jgi:soluble lytic murein transglycosylase-like protein
MNIHTQGTPADPGWIGGVVIIALAAAVVKPPENLWYHTARFFRLDSGHSRAIIRDEVTRAADAYGLDRNVYHALIQVESAGQVKAQSKVGARGLSQVMPFNAKRCGWHPDRLWDPTHNVRCGAQILREELDRTGDYTAALTVYNCGKINCTQGKQYARKVLSLARKLG